MTQAFNTNYISVILQDSISKLSHKLNFSFRQRYKSIEIIQFDSEKDFADFKDLYIRKIEHFKVFDKFFIVFNGTLKSRPETFNHFFDFIANDYDNIVDKNSNLNNTERLIKLVTNNMNSAKEPLILDFGSGTGVSSLVRHRLKEEGIFFRLISYDSSEEMSKISKRMGLDTLSYNALANLPDNSIDGIFSSFTFHYLTDLSIIELLWQKLKPNGILAANFHKNIGLDNLKSFISDLNGDSSEIYSSVGGSVYSFTKNVNPFIDKRKVVSFLSENYGIEVEEEFFDRLYFSGIISLFDFDGISYVISADIESLIPFCKAIRKIHREVSFKDLYLKNFIVSTSDLTLEFNDQSVSPAGVSNISFLRNLIFSYRESTGVSTIKVDNIVRGVTISSRNKTINEMFHEHENLRSIIDQSRVSIFTNSASYMGSKKVLRTFIVEGIGYYLSSKSRVLDLMCGSGTVAGAMSLKWDTSISDAMQFCRSLGKVQGSGFNNEKANQILNSLQEHIQFNIGVLKTIFHDELNVEDDLLHSEINENLLQRYNEFCKDSSYPNEKFKALYSRGINDDNQYALFTSAYSNLYLGLRQAVELDSIRFAIDQLVDKEDRSWALAALTTTLSAVGNSYGGHFAQPKFKNISTLKLNGLFKLIEQRSLSINNEFSVRLRWIAHESEKHTGKKIQVYDGPWQTALQNFVQQTNELDLVYLDAPYTRDEYSRFYHILETLNEYKYFPIKGVGRVPEKKLSSRFSSEFFTKTSNKLKFQYVNIISKIVQNNCICAWSYSDSATVNAFEIITEIFNKNSCTVSSLSAPHMYKAQGGNKAKNINEYLVFFVPKNS